MIIPRPLARRLAVRSQLLDRDHGLAPGKSGVFQAIDRLGYVQIDTIATIQRAHHHTLWTRRNDYAEDMLHELQSQDRWVFEYWAHAMAYLPMADYRFCLPRMANFRNPTGPWAKHLFEKHQAMLQPVLERIRAEGPLGAGAFEAAPGKKGGTWWDWKPAKMALELLFWRGELMISGRKNFQKIYDLTERVLPPEIDTRMPSTEEIGRFLVQRALTAHGLANEREISKFMQPASARDADMQLADKVTLMRAIQHLLEAQVIMPVQLEGNANSIYYARPEALERASQSTPESASVHLLSPFDNLIIQRDRVQRLFAFDYSLECYVPAAKRKFGYFAVPILWQDSLIGQMDPKADRKLKSLIIHQLAFELSCTQFEALLPLLAQRLVDFARFNGCETVRLGKIVPERIGPALSAWVEEAITG